MSASAFFHSVKRSLYALFALTVASSSSTICRQTARKSTGFGSIGIPSPHAPERNRAVSDNMLNAVNAAFHHLDVLPRGTIRIGDVLKPTRGEQDRAEGIPDVVAHDRQNPLFEVAGQGELLLGAVSLCVLRPAALVDVYTAPDESGEVALFVLKGTPRSNIQRYAPSWRRSRYSNSNAAGRSASRSGVEKIRCCWGFFPAEP